MYRSLINILLFHFKPDPVFSSSSNKPESSVPPALPSQTASSSPSTPGTGELHVGSQALRDLMELAEDGMTLTQYGYADKGKPCHAILLGEKWQVWLSRVTVGRDEKDAVSEIWLNLDYVHFCSQAPERFHPGRRVRGSGRAVGRHCQQQLGSEEVRSARGRPRRSQTWVGEQNVFRYLNWPSYLSKNFN